MNPKQTSIFSTLTDEEIEMMQIIDKKIEAGEDVPTIFPNCIRRTKDGKWYEFFCNFDNKKLEHVEAVIHALQITEYIHLSKHAFNNQNQALDNCFSAWVPAGSTPESVINEFYRLYHDLSVKYKELLLQCGVPADELKMSTEIYLGCERDRWPDKPWITDKIHELTTRQILPERER